MKNGLRARWNAARILTSGLLASLGCAATPAYAPPGPKVPIEIIDTRPDSSLQITLRSEAEQSHCRAPCALSFPSGDAEIEVQTDFKLRQRIVLPPQPARIMIQRRRDRQFYGGLALQVAADLIWLSGLTGWRVYSEFESEALRKLQPTLADHYRAQGNVGLGVAAGGLALSLASSLVMWKAGKNQAVLAVSPTR